jgi:hypothetical protein
MSFKKGRENDESPRIHRLQNGNRTNYLIFIISDASQICRYPTPVCLYIRPDTGLTSRIQNTGTVTKMNYSYTHQIYVPYISHFIVLLDDSRK